MYSFNSRVRFTELNHPKNALSCSSIINYFQDCSTFQSEDLNLGISYLSSKNRVWLLNSWQLQIYHPAGLGENITVGTWPYGFKRFYGYRNFLMKDEKDEIIAAANSIWVYLDTTTGKPVKVPEDNAGYILEPPYPMEQVQRKIEIPDRLISYPSFLVRKTNIDSYNHVNNGQYVKMAENYLPADFCVSTMRVEYRMQAVLGDIIIPLISEESGCIKVILANKDSKPYSVIEFNE